MVNSPKLKYFLKDIFQIIFKYFLPSIGDIIEDFPRIRYVKNVAFSLQFFLRFPDQKCAICLRT